MRRLYSEYRVTRDEVSRVGYGRRSRRVVLGRERQIQRFLSRCHSSILRTWLLRMRRNRSAHFFCLIFTCFQNSKKTNFHSNRLNVFYFICKYRLFCKYRLLVLTTLFHVALFFFILGPTLYHCTLYIRCR